MCVCVCLPEIGQALEVKCIDAQLEEEHLCSLHVSIFVTTGAARDVVLNGQHYNFGQLLDRIRRHWLGLSTKLR